MTKKRAFTLAEVLITLAIIGIIAALTVPTLMSKYRRHLYETSFKRAYTMLSQGTAQMIQENGDNIVNPEIFINKSGQAAEISFLNYYSKFLGGSRKSAYYDWNNSQERNFSAFADNSYTGTGCGQGILPLKNNMDITMRVACSVSGQTVSGGPIGVIMVDTNTIDKKPNRWGYDVWAFWIDINKKALVPEGTQGAHYGHTPFKCGSKGEAKANQDYGCSYYALINQCPDDETKTYWECIKP